MHLSRGEKDRLTTDGKALRPYSNRATGELGAGGSRGRFDADKRTRGQAAVKFTSCHLNLRGSPTMA
jgi:hypothetical protein